MLDPRYVNGHIEVYEDGIFQFSCDTMAEATREMVYGDDKE